MKNRLILAILVLFVISSLIPSNFAVAEDDTAQFLNIDVKDIDGKTVEITWKTSVKTNGKILYGKSSDKLDSYLIENRKASTYHDMQIGNLQKGITYYYQIVAYDGSSDIYSYVKSFKASDQNDTTKPRIIDARISYIGGTVVVISWETDEESSTVVEYDEYKTYAEQYKNNSKTISHQVILKKLKNNTRYFIRAYSFDKAGNQSGYFIKEFITKDISFDEGDLDISYLRPNSASDVNIEDKLITVSFKTNHYSNGTITLKRLKSKIQVKNLDYNSSHETVFNGLAPNTEYLLYISMKDIFGKKIEIEAMPVTTKKNQPVKIIVASEPVNTNAPILNSGYYGQYFNLPDDISNIKQTKTEEKGKATGWYDEKYLSFSRIDKSLDFGEDFFPVDENLKRDPYYFSVYWKAIIDVPSDGTYSYNIQSDDDSWIYIDSNLVFDLGGIHKAKYILKDIYLTKGTHYLEIYFAERRPTKSVFSFNLDQRINVKPWTEEKEISKPEIAKTTGYAPAQLLYKTKDSPDVYAIINNQRYYIPSPSSFYEYGYKWSDVKTVSKDELLKYPRVRLVKSKNNSDVYYIYQKPEGQWFKINIPSPTVFVSYPNNFWGNIVTVNQEDIDYYPDVKFIKTFDDPAVYLLEDNIKHFISESIFKRYNFNSYEIVEISNSHMQNYRTGQILQ